MKCEPLALAEKNWTPDWAEEWLTFNQAELTSPHFRWRILIGKADLTAMAKLVAHVVESHCHSESASHRIGQRALCDEAGISRNTLRRALAELEEAGFLEIEAGRTEKGSTQQRATYSLAWPLVAPPRVQTKAPGSTTHPGPEMTPVRDAPGSSADTPGSATHPPGSRDDPHPGAEMTRTGCGDDPRVDLGVPGVPAVLHPRASDANAPDGAHSPQRINEVIKRLMKRDGWVSTRAATRQYESDGTLVRIRHYAERFPDAPADHIAQMLDEGPLLAQYVNAERAAG